MFAIVRTGGKQYRIAAGDKIAVEKIDGATGEVFLGEVPVRLTPKEWAVLERLSRREGVTVTRAQLEDTLYAFDAEVESNAIEAHVSRLRAKLGRQAIETVRGFGYRIGRA